MRLIALAVITLASLSGHAHAALLAPREAAVLLAPGGSPPPSQAAWAPVALPDDAAVSRPGREDAAAWYQINFDLPRRPAGDEPWAAYFPYFYYGGTVWLNGQLLQTMAMSNDQIHAWSYRPRLVPLPAPLLRAGRNEIAVWAAQPEKYPMRMARLFVGPQAELQPLYDWRLFWVRVVPQFTVIGSLLVAAFVLSIWWVRKSEVLYGLFGIAAALWGVRSLTFVIDIWPLPEWLWWRLIYQCATGGFVIAMALFTLRLAGIRWPGVERGLLAYALVGPLWFALKGFGADLAVARWWLGGMIPVGIGIIAFAFWSVLKRRDLSVGILAASMAFAVLVGIHDYLLVWNPSLLATVLPEWTGQRIFLLHFGSNTMLLAMGVAVTARYIDSLTSLEDLNRTLETRVADRERALAANYEQLAALQREHAATEERQLIMRDLHDGLGSQLFTSLSRVERGDMNERQIAAALRACIADMRIALDALASETDDVGSAVGNFMYRWKTELVAAGIHPTWDFDETARRSDISPHSALQLLRIAQEALTNVLKHARATQVQVRLRKTPTALQLEVEDNGHGMTDASSRQGRGLANMQARARRIGGQLQVHASGNGTCVVLQVPLSAQSGKPQGVGARRHAIT